MKCKTIVLWWLINDVNEREVPGLDKDEMRIKALMPLVSELFPGINYYSISGFNGVLNECVIPILKKRYPKLLDTPAKKIDPKATTEVTAVLPSKGYEWQNSPKWKSKFEKLLAAA